MKRVGLVILLTIIGSVAAYRALIAGYYIITGDELHFDTGIPGLSR